MMIECDNCGKEFFGVIDFDSIFDASDGEMHAVAICHHCKEFTFPIIETEGQEN